MKTPRIEINIAKIAYNAKKLRELYRSKDIDVFGVTKVVCGDPRIADALTGSGITTLADSRISNILRMREAGIGARFVLLRTPIPSQIGSVARYADISLNSELSVIRGLSEAALKYGVTHGIILMVEMGDLREGMMPRDLEETVRGGAGAEGDQACGHRNESGLSWGDQTGCGKDGIPVLTGHGR